MAGGFTACRLGTGPSGWFPLLVRKIISQAAIFAQRERERGFLALHFRGFRLPAFGQPFVKMYSI